MKLTTEQQQKILEYKKYGYSSRDIALIVLGKKSRKSTVNDFLASQKQNVIKPSPKILVFDIETSPSLAYVWGRYDQNVSQEQVISETFILSYAAKWLNQDGIMFGMLTGDEIEQENDLRIVKELRQLLDEADIVITHNGIKFDSKVVNTRMVFHGLFPPSPYKHIDTLVIAKSKFRFPSNRLGDLCKYLKIETKLETGGFSLWRNVLNKNEAAMEKMLQYNIRDCIILENVYIVLRAWHSTHPNLQVYSTNSDTVCPCCMSDDITKTDQKVFTNIQGYELYVCEKCGKYFRSRKNIIDLENKMVGL